MSPYLFLLCAEGFSALLAKSKEKGGIKGVAVCRNAPCISHLLFADDSLLFCQVSLEEVQCVTDIFQLYAESSGQCINFEISSIYFSSNMGGEQRDMIKSMLGVKEVEKLSLIWDYPHYLADQSTKLFLF